MLRMRTIINVFFVLPDRIIRIEFRFKSLNLGCGQTNRWEITGEEKMKGMSDCVRKSWHPDNEPGAKQDIR